MTRRNHFTRSEDMVITEIVKERGLNEWEFIASLLKNRSAQQCKCRYYQHLDPRIKTKPWTLEEDELLRQKVAVYGRKWKIIREKSFPNRSETDIKNRWYRKINIVTKLHDPTVKDDKMTFDLISENKELPKHCKVLLPLNFDNPNYIRKAKSELEEFFSEFIDESVDQSPWIAEQGIISKE